METLVRAGMSNAVTATVLALIVACLSRPLARRPAILHGLWLLVLVKLITPPMFELAIPWPIPASTADAPQAELCVVRIESLEAIAPNGSAAPDGLALVEPPGQETRELRLSPTSETQGLAPFGRTLSRDWCLWTGLTWIVGTLVLFAVSAIRIRRFHRLLRSACPATGEEREWVETLAGVMELRRVPEVCWVRARVSPLVWSLGRRPRLVLPRDLWKTLDKRQRSTLVVHELAHLKRGDHLVRFLEFVVSALYWWHPLLWWIRQSLRDAEEQCCDAWVVWAFPEAAKAYAETLLDTLDFVHRSDVPEPLLASGLGKVPHLRKRLTMIMTGTTFRVLGVRGTLGLLALAGIMLPVGATWAQEPKEPTELRVVVKADDELAEPVEDVVRVTANVNTDEPSQERKVVVLRLDAKNKTGDELSLSGPIDEVVKKLEAHIRELKQGANRSDDVAARIKGLVEAVDHLKKAGKAAPRLAAFQVRLDTPDAKDQPEVAKLRQEVLQLRKSMEKTLRDLQSTQEKIRKLGGDPGDIATVQWRRTPKNAYTELHTMTITKPVEAVRVRPSIVTVKPADVKVLETRVVEHQILENAIDPVVVTDKPSLERKRHTVILRDDVKKPTAETPEPSRLERLEKRLKALQDEVDGLKKGSK